MTQFYYQAYESVESLVAACTESVKRTGSVHGGFKGGITREHFIGRKFSHWDDVAAAATSPWDEGMVAVTAMLNQLRGEGDKLPKPRDRRRRRLFSEDGGDEVEFDRLRSGQPYWQTTRRERVEGPQRVAVVSDVCTSACVSHTKILWRGCAAIVLADLLEQAGYRVGLWIAHYNTGAYVDGWGHFCGTMLKDYQQPLDAATLVTAVSGWFYRTVCFQSYCVRPKVKETDGLGSVRTIYPNNEYLAQLVGRGTVPVIIDHVWNMASAVQKVRDTINLVNQGSQEVTA